MVSFTMTEKETIKKTHEIRNRINQIDIIININMITQLMTILHFFVYWNATDISFDLCIDYVYVNVQ